MLSHRSFDTVLLSSFDHVVVADEDRGGDEKLDKKNYALLCDELRKYFDQAPEKFELSMAIPASISRYEAGFDFEKLKNSVHFFNGKQHRRSFPSLCSAMTYSFTFQLWRMICMAYGMTRH